ncbi:MAG TPA: type II toxin-antitoxin system VapC family toxin [Acetobacteraceae bacterium]
MTLVIDASVALKWFLQEAGSDEAAALLDREDLLIAPDLIVAEVCNAGWKAVRAGTALAQQLEVAAARLPAVLDELVPLRALAADAAAASLALDHPAYDCFYLALAAQRDARLVTADRRLLRPVADTRWARYVVALSAAR